MEINNTFLWSLSFYCVVSVFFFIKHNNQISLYGRYRGFEKSMQLCTAWPKVNDNSIQNRVLDMWALRRQEIGPVSHGTNTEFPIHYISNTILKLNVDQIVSCDPQNV